MRIVIFCNDYWPTVGGVQTAVRGLARALRRRGHAVLILTRQPGGSPPSGVLDGITIQRFEWNLRPRLTFPVRALRTLKHVRRAVREWSPEIVYVHFVTAHALYACDCARSSNAPLILSFRGNDALRIAPRSLATRRAYALLTRAARVNLFCSDWLRREIAGAPWFRGVPERTGLLRDAVDVLDREAPSETPSAFALAAGRLVAKKGFDLLLRAWAQMDSRVPLPLWIAGDGPELGALLQLAVELGIASRVRFLGPIPHPQLLGLLERAAICIVPSREEPYGIIVLEAQALGVPVLACAVGNIPALIEHRVTGYLVDPTVDGLARGLAEAWDDPRRAAVAAAARHSAGATRSYDCMAEELERWAEVAGGKDGKAFQWT